MPFVTWTLFVSLAFADGEAALAEYKRLSGEMEMFGQRHMWKGVDKHYLKMEELNVTIKESDYVLGAQAAQELGKMRDAAERLRAAEELNGSNKTRQWLREIEEGYGNVDLKVTSKGEIKLEIDEYPMDPIKRNVIDVAQTQLLSEGAFIGMLPVGHYTFVDYEFDVQSGVSIRLELSPKQRRNGLVQPKYIDHTNFDVE
jgi:hypothetical protein